MARASIRPVAAIVATAVLVTVVAGALAIRFAPSSDDAARAALAALLDRRYDAILAGDVDAYMGTVDPARTFLRDCSRQRFDAYVGRPHPTAAPRASIGPIERWGNYVRAWVGTDEGWYREFMRFDGGRWLISEPYPSELGENRITEYAGVKLHYSAGDADLAQIVGADLAPIIARVVARAHEPPVNMFEMRLATLSDPGGDCFVLGLAEDWGTTVVSLNDVELATGYAHISSDTAITVEHEALHWLQNDYAKQLHMRKEPDWWVIEGWPTFLTDPPSSTERHDAICESPPSFEDIRGGPRPNATTEDIIHSYVVASLLIERVTGSDNDAYWRFFDEFGGTTDPYLRATGADGASFYQMWLQQSRAQFC